MYSFDCNKSRYMDMKYRLVCECALDWKNIIEYATSERTFIRPALAIRYCNVNLLYVFTHYTILLSTLSSLWDLKKRGFFLLAVRTLEESEMSFCYIAAVTRNEKRDILDYHFTVIWNSYVWSYPSILDVIDSTWYTYICLLVI